LLSPDPLLIEKVRDVVGSCVDEKAQIQALEADLAVHLIMDNYGTHKTPLIQRWLVKRPRFHVQLAIRTFIDAHNIDPKPFVWTKTAGHILAASPDSPSVPSMIIPLKFLREPRGTGR
jgi:hypothetical protein